MINVAMISAWHVHAEGYADKIAESGKCKICTVWDEIPKRGKKWADKLGCSFTENYEDVLSDGNIDAVAVCAPTNMHYDLILKAAKAGKHIFTEKVLTLKKCEAEEIKREVIKNKVHFTISYPQESFGKMIFAKKLADSGELGKLTYARVRNVHSGSINDWLPPHFYDKEQCGGGAMIDLGAHPMYLLEWFLGKPESISSAFTNVTDRPVEDNAVCLLKYSNGAIGVSETGFVSLFDKFTVEISGTEGCIRIVGDDLTYCTKKTDGWVSKDTSEYDEISPLDYWIDSIESGSENLKYGIDDAVALTALMQAAYEAAQSGEETKVQ